ncbi:polysaccharide deacetylase [halophilic archaeon]|nr:polysaccharide deacetylase [halophilic archaeon]
MRSGRTDGGRVARRRFLRFAGAAVAGSVAGCVNDSPEGAGGATSTRETATTADEETRPRTTPENETTRTDDDPSLRTAYRSRRRYRSPGESLDAMEALGAWRVRRGSMRPDPGQAFVGAKSAKLVGDGGGHAVVERTLPRRDFSDADVSVALRTTTPDSVAFFVQLLDANGNAAEQQLRSITWDAPDVGWFRTCPGTYVADDEFDRSAVTRLRLRLNNASDRRVVAWVDDVRVHPKPDTGYVVFSWDDGKRSYYRNAASAHDEYGFPAVLTQPPHPDDAGSKLFMSVDQLRERRDAGDEIVAHGSVQRPFARVSESTLDGILRRNKRWLVDNGFEGADFVVYPGNNYDATALDVVGRYHHMGGMNQAGSVNTTGVHGFDPLVLPRTIGHDLTIAKRLVDRVAAHRNAGILNFHDFASENTMSVADYRALLEHVDRTSGVEVVTFSDLWRLRTGGP